MKIFKEYLFTSIVTGIAVGILFPIFASGDNVLVSKAMIQLGWCQADDSVCLVSRYLLAVMPLLFLAMIVDVSINLIKKQIEKAKTNPQPKPSVPEENLGPPQELKWVAVIYDEPIWQSVRYWAAVRIDNKLNCHRLTAKVEKIVYTGVDLWNNNPGEVTTELNIDVINPTGDNLVWNAEGNTCLLHVVRERAVFVYDHGRTSFPLPPGKFEIEISIKGKAIKDAKVVKTLKVEEVSFSRYGGRHLTGLTWLRELSELF